MPALRGSPILRAGGATGRSGRTPGRISGVVARGVLVGVLWLAGCRGGDQLTAPSTAVDPANVPAAAPHTFDIQVRFLGDGATPRLREAFSRAAARWSQVIVGDIGSTPLNAPAGECQPWMPAVRETVNDLVIYVRAARIDGPDQIVARASPCYVNAESKLPMLGFFELDSDDLDALVNRNVLDDVVLHEMGHVLGIGTLWNYKRTLLVGAGTDDPYFTGSQARGAFASVGGNGYGGATVPVENSGSAGTRDTHWRTSLFGAELMQGVVQPGGMPLSAITVASLADLGYPVSLAAADRYVLIPALRMGGGAAELTPLADDIVRVPMYDVDRRGARRRITPW